MKVIGHSSRLKKLASMRSQGASYEPVQSGLHLSGDLPASVFGAENEMEDRAG